MISLKRLNISFTNRKILDDINMDIKNNKLTIIKGESGSGKTTLLKCLMLKLEHNADYQYLNQNVTKQMIRDDFYMIYQDPIFIENMTVNEMFSLISEEYEKHDLLHVLDKLCIKELYEKYPNQLSQGERKRVSLASGILRNKKVLIIDEPTSSLNVEYSAIVAEILRDYTRLGHIVIASSHDLIMEDYADYVFMINNRKLESIIQNADSHTCKESNKFEFSKEIKVKIKQLFKMYKHRLMFKKSKENLIVLLISLASVLMIFDNGAITFHKGLVNNISSAEVMVFKNISGDGSFDYSCVGDEYPLLDEEIEFLHNLDNIEKITYRFDYAMFEGIKENCDPRIEDRNESINKIQIKQNGKIIEKDLVSIFQDYTVCMKSYNTDIDYNHRFEKVNTDKKGIVLSKTLYDKLFDEDVDINDLSIYLPIYVPVYDCDGIKEIGTEESDEYYSANAIATKEIWIELPIVGKLIDESIYDNYDNAGEYTFFVDQDILEEYRKTYKKTEGYTIYWCLYDDKMNKYINEVPEEYKDTIRQIIRVDPWQPNCYVLYMNSIHDLETGLQEIHKAGIDAKSIYINATTLQASVKTLQTSIRLVSLAIVVILFYTEYSMKKKSKSEDHKMNLFFENMGFEDKEIKKFIAKNSFVQFVSRFLVCLIISFILTLVIRIMFNSNTVISLELLFYIFLLCFSTEVILPFIVNRKGAKDDKN